MALNVLSIYVPLILKAICCRLVIRNGLSTGECNYINHCSSMSKINNFTDVGKKATSNYDMF